MRSDMVADGCFAWIVCHLHTDELLSNGWRDRRALDTKVHGSGPLATTRVTSEIFTNTKRKVLCTHHSIAVNS